MNGYLDDVITSLVLILPKMSGYVKTFKDKSRDKNKNNKLMSFHTDNALAGYDGRYVKTKIRTCNDKVYTDFYGLNFPNVNILQSFLSILYLFMKRNITCKCI